MPLFQAENLNIAIGVISYTRFRININNRSLLSLTIVNLFNVLDLNSQLSLLSIGSRIGCISCHRFGASRRPTSEIPTIRCNDIRSIGRRITVLTFSKLPLIILIQRAMIARQILDFEFALLPNRIQHILGGLIRRVRVQADKGAHFDIAFRRILIPAPTVELIAIAREHIG